MGNDSAVSGWYVFAGVLLALAGVLNIVWGIAAIGDSKFFTENGTYIVSGLNTWGWITLLIGVIQSIAAASLFGGSAFGRVIGIVAAALSAFSALLSISAAPFWALCIFALAIIVIYELAKPRERIEAVS